MIYRDIVSIFFRLNDALNLHMERNAWQHHIIRVLMPGLRSVKSLAGAHITLQMKEVNAMAIHNKYRI